MKKRICLLLTLIIAIFIGVNSVEAFSMFLDCKYTADCTNDIGSGFWDLNAWARWCVNDQNYFVPITDKKGNLDYYIIGSTGTYMSLDTSYNGYGCWLKDFTDENCSKADLYQHGPYNIFSEGVCPSGVVNEKGAHDFFNKFPIIGKITEHFIIIEGIPVGKQGKINDKSDINETKYVIYSFTNSDGVSQMIAEAYTSEGKYCYAGGNIKTSFKEVWYNDSNGEELVKYQLDQAYNLKADFWKVHTNYKSRIVFSNTDAVSLDGMNVCAGMSESECAKDEKNGGHNYKVIIDSEDSNNNIKKAVEKWYDQIIGESEKLKPIGEIVNKDKFIDTCIKFNDVMSEGKKYKFSNSYTKEMFINDLNDAYDAVNTAYSENNIISDYVTGKGTSATSSIISKIYVDYLGIKEFTDIAEKNDKEYYVNVNYIVAAIKRDIREALEKHILSGDVAIDILNITENILDYMEMFYTSVAYLKKDSSLYELDASQVSNIESLKGKFEDFVEENSINFRPVIDCESLLGEELIAKINKYLDIFKIAVPILLIGLGIIDFTKAIFASDEDKMKKAKDTFIKRLFVAILIFLSPLLVNLILSLANKVWSFISPNSCGFFE